MYKGIKKIIKESAFAIQEGRFVYTKVSEVPKMGSHFMITKDRDEITVVTKEENLPTLAVMETNKDFYRMIALNVSVPFYAVGFLAAVSQAIAQQGMNVLIVSTYSRDYIMVREDSLEEARVALRELGFQEIQ